MKLYSGYMGLPEHLRFGYDEFQLQMVVTYLIFAVFWVALIFEWVQNWPRKVREASTATSMSRSRTLGCFLGVFLGSPPGASAGYVFYVLTRGPLGGDFAEIKIMAHMLLTGCMVGAILGAIVGFLVGPSVSKLMQQRDDSSKAG